MLRRYLPLTLAAFGLGACAVGTTSPAPADTQVIVQPAAPVTSTAPMAPPAPRSEMVPPPPASSRPVIWQPGHWRYTGVANAPWSWQSGQYVPAPQGATAWVPGQWVNQGNGWVWQDGHWS